MICHICDNSYCSLPPTGHRPENYCGIQIAQFERFEFHNSSKILSMTTLRDSSEITTFSTFHQLCRSPPLQYCHQLNCLRRIEVMSIIEEDVVREVQASKA